MPKPAIPYKAMIVDVALIDEPDNPMRETFDPQKMDELIQSIKEVGLIQPPSLIRTNGRFRVAAGHRRCLAASAAGLEKIHALVYPEGTPTEEALKNHENAFREDVNPAQEALYFQNQLEHQCGNDVLRLCGVVGRKQGYVEGRLNLLRGYPEVFEALRQGRITVAVALEFNKYKDHGHMLAHLDTAIVSGAKSTQVQRWRIDLERNMAMCAPVETPDGAMPAGQSIEPPRMACIVCESSADPYNLEFAYIHRGGPCPELLKRALDRLAGGSGGE
jgi:ParB/RepB/Spo0J family partition protein